jgi:hypothetical protein
MTKFNHKKILKVAEGIIVYGTVTFIVTCCVMILVNVIVNGAPHIPCDICY